MNGFGAVVQTFSRNRGATASTCKAAALLVMAMAVYLPAMRGGFIWDDTDYVLNNQTLRADAFDEYGRERLLEKGTVLSPDLLQAIPYEQMVRLKIQSDDPRLEGDLRLLEERTDRQVEVIRQLFEEKKAAAAEEKAAAKAANPSR